MTSSTPPADQSARNLNRNALALHVNTVVGSGLGFIFLIVAARLYEDEPAIFGRDMALVSAMMLLAAIAELNIGRSLPRFIPRMGKRSGRTILLGYATSSVAALLLGGMFVAIAPMFIASFDILQTSTTLGIAFVGSIVLYNVFATQDSVLAALRRAFWVPVENTVFGILKIVLMVIWAGSAIENGIFYAWAVPLAVLVIPISAAIFFYAVPRHVAATGNESLPDEDLTGKRQIFRYLGLDYLASLLTHLATSVLPLVVIAILGAEANASFAIVFPIIVALEQLVFNTGLSLTVESSFDRTAMVRLIRHTFKRFGPLYLLITLGGIAAAPIILMPFGGSYSDTATTILRLLLIGALPQAVLVVYQTIERIQGRSGRIVLSTLAQTVLTLGLCIALAYPFGLAGIGWGWVIANFLVTAAILPALFKVMKAPS